MGAAAMNKMHIQPTDRSREMVKAVDAGFLGAPVVVVQPVPAQFAQVVQICAVIPTAIIGHFVPGKIRNPGPNLA